MSNKVYPRFCGLSLLIIMDVIKRELLSIRIKPSATSIGRIFVRFYPNQIDHEDFTPEKVEELFKDLIKDCAFAGKNFFNIKMYGHQHVPWYNKKGGLK